MTIEQIQAMITAGATQRQVINELADYVQANDGGGGLIYKALLRQTGTNTPTAITQTNSLGGAVSVARDDVGSYRLTSAGLFVGIDNCFITTQLGSQQSGFQCHAACIDDSTIEIFIYDNNWTLVDLGSLSTNAGLYIKLEING